jgi:hypothetical protein
VTAGKTVTKISTHYRIGVFLASASVGVQSRKPAYRTDTPNCAKPNCEPTTRHSMAWGITRQNCQSKNSEQEHTLSYCPTRASMRILEIENRCTGNRLVNLRPSVPSRHRWGPEPGRPARADFWPARVALCPWAASPALHTLRERRARRARRPQKDGAARGWKTGGSREFREGGPTRLGTHSKPLTHDGGGAWTHKTDSQMLTWMCRPMSVIGGKADMARTCQYVR